MQTLLTLILTICIPLLLSRLTPGGGVLKEGADIETATNPAESEASSRDASSEGRTHADRLNRSRLLSASIGVIGICAIAVRVSSLGTAAIDLNLVNLLFLSLGLLLHRSLVAYLAAVTSGGQAIVGIVVQFPLYAGIQALMVHSGLSMSISQGFESAAIALADSLGLSAGTTFPIATFLSAGLVNFFVPSGGGQWIVQGQIMCNASASLGLPLEQTVMAVAYGDQWTNMIQPFWAIPLIGLTGVNARQFMGYCALLMLLAMPVFVLALIVS